MKKLNKQQAQFLRRLNALSIWTNDDGIVVGKCYGGCY